MCEFEASITSPGRVEVALRNDKVLGFFTWKLNQQKFRAVSPWGAPRSDLPKDGCCCCLALGLAAYHYVEVAFFVVNESIPFKSQAQFWKSPWLPRTKLFVGSLRDRWVGGLSSSFHAISREMVRFVLGSLWSSTLSLPSGASMCRTSSHLDGILFQSSWFSSTWICKSKILVQFISIYTSTFQGVPNTTLNWHCLGTTWHPGGQANF